MQKRKSFTKPFEPSSQEEIFFTMKVYATKSGDEIKTLKYSIDLHPPFEANTNTVEPYASPLVENNMKAFQKIFRNVVDVLKFISNPTKFTLDDKKSDKSYPAWRYSEQERLAEAIKLAKGAINHITYEKNSPPVLTVGAVFRTTGNGDMKPPPPPDTI
jgi:hypothetical protein